MSEERTNGDSLHCLVRCFIVEDDNLVGICGTCNACGADVAKYLCNQTLVEKRSEAVMFDMWAACTNPVCGNHEGRGYYMDAPDFFTPNAWERDEVGEYDLARALRKYIRDLKKQNAEHEPRAIASRAPCSCSARGYWFRCKCGQAICNHCGNHYDDTPKGVIDNV